jgi:hypothetical protein
MGLGAWLGHDGAVAAVISTHAVYVCVDRETGEPTLGAGMNLANVTDFDCATVRVPRRQ